jgi:glyoxylase-like metal-dependent hydrolase (beta-lactamase superfamily II)
MRIALLLLCGLFFIASCTSTPSGPKLYVFDCGALSFDDVSAFGLTNEETPVREMFVPCYLIRHQGQELLWDGGLPVGIAGMPQQAVPGGGNMSYKRSIVDQLGDLGLAPEDIEYTAYSHFHFDHVGAANAFPSSTLFIQAAEYEAAFKHAEDYEIFDPSLYDKLANTPRTVIEGDHDVFGDGRVMIYSAPGHTPGHQVLSINLDNMGQLILSGDLYHFEASRRMRRVPVFNTDAAATRRSMTKIEDLVKSTNATLWIEHSKALADTLRKAPEFYD